MCWSTVEIHYTRAAPFNKMCQNSPNKSFFRVGILPRCYVRFCKIGSMERQKRITFKKKCIKKLLFVEEICYFQEQKMWHFLNKSGTFPNGNQWKLKIPKIDFHWFPFGNVSDFRGKFTLFCSWKWHISSANNSFLINFFLKVILFWCSIDPILQNLT